MGLASPPLTVSRSVLYGMPWAGPICVPRTSAECLASPVRIRPQAWIELPLSARGLTQLMLPAPPLPIEASKVSPVIPSSSGSLAARLAATSSRLTKVRVASGSAISLISTASKARPFAAPIGSMSRSPWPMILKPETLTAVTMAASRRCGSSMMILASSSAVSSAAVKPGSGDGKGAVSDTFGSGASGLGGNTTGPCGTCSWANGTIALGSNARSSAPADGSAPGSSATGSPLAAGVGAVAPHPTSETMSAPHRTASRRRRLRDGVMRQSPRAG